MTAAPAVATSVAALREAISAATPAGASADSVGFVPTMGFLHEGHATLIRRARAECGVVVVSIFVNPTQFGPGEDFATYPRDLPRDLALLAREHASVAFVPEASELYPPGADTSAPLGAVAEPLDGIARPGHFRGVAMVVQILLRAVQPARAYFGEKDWQQLQVVRQLVRDAQLPVEIVGVPTVREPDGLALSSRNVRLSPAERVQALCVPRALDAARAAYAGGERDPAALERVMAEVVTKEPAARLDYAVVVRGETLRKTSVADASSRALIAVRIGATRLIDNCALRETLR